MLCCGVLCGGCGWGREGGVVYFRGKGDLSVWLHGSLRIDASSGQRPRSGCWKVRMERGGESTTARRVAQRCGAVIVVLMEAALDDKGG